MKVSIDYRIQDIVTEDLSTTISHVNTHMFVVLITFVAACTSCAKQQPVDAITESILHKHIAILASDEFGGRDLADSDAWPQWQEGDVFRAIRDAMM